MRLEAHQIWEAFLSLYPAHQALVPDWWPRGAAAWNNRLCMYIFEVGPVVVGRPRIWWNGYSSEFIEIDYLPRPDYDSSLAAFRRTWPHCLCRARFEWLESLIDSAVIMHRWKVHKETKINTLKPSGNTIVAIRWPKSAQTKTPVLKPPPYPILMSRIRSKPKDIRP